MHLRASRTSFKRPFVHIFPTVRHNSTVPAQKLSFTITDFPALQFAVIPLQSLLTACKIRYELQPSIKINLATFQKQSLDVWITQTQKRGFVEAFKEI